MKHLIIYFFYTLQLFFTIQYTSVFYCINSLTLPTVFSEMFLFFILYISSFFKPFVLLQSLFKCLLILRSLGWPLLPKLLVLLFIKSLTLQPLQLFALVFLYTAKVYQLYAVLQFLYLLQCSIYKHNLITTLISSFPLKKKILLSILIIYLIKSIIFLISSININIS